MEATTMVALKNEPVIFCESETPQHQTDFAELLRSMRLESEISAYVLAERAGITGERWHALEAGEQEPAECELWRLSMLLGVAFEELLLLTERYEHPYHTLNAYCQVQYGQFLKLYGTLLGERVERMEAEVVQNGSLLLSLSRLWRTVRIKFPADAEDAQYIACDTQYGGYHLFPQVTYATLWEALQWLAGNR
jgi:transcriptional regulator with XRE-family HTH domain